MTDAALAPRWDDSPRKRAHVSELILKVPPGPPKDYLCASTRITGVWTHYFNRRTVPCMSADGGCLFDHKLVSSRWQGWLAVQSAMGSGRWGWLLVTESAFQRNPLVHPSQPQLRGRTLRVGRLGKEVNSAMFVQLDPFEPDKRRLIVEPNAREFLLALWGSLDQFRSAQGPRLQPGRDAESPVFEAFHPGLGGRP